MTIIGTLTDPVVASLLSQGAVGVLPTDTIYGIVARTADIPAVQRLYRIKHREGKPGTVVAADMAQLEALGIESQYIKKVSHLWPGPVSVVLPAGNRLAYLHQGKDSLAVRIPRDEQLRALLRQTGPLLTSSANHPGEPAASTIAQAQQYFGEDADFYVDGGDISGRSPSTVARLTPDGHLEVLRQGATIVK